MCGAVENTVAQTANILIYEDMLGFFFFRLRKFEDQMYFYLFNFLLLVENINKSIVNFNKYIKKNIVLRLTRNEMIICAVLISVFKIQKDVHFGKQQHNQRK